MNYRNSKVVITGGAGFIGKNLANTLADMGASVTIVDLPDSDYSSLSPSIQIQKGSIMDQEFLMESLQNSEYVFHLAAKTDLSGSTLEDYEVNYSGTANVIEALKDNSNLKKLVVYSTQLVVGIFNEKRFINCDEPFRTKTLYGKSKILTEQTTIEKCKQYHLPYIIIRPTSVYGPFGKEPYRDYFLMIKRRRYFHVGKADNLISMVYVKNLVDQTLFLASQQTDEKVFFGNDLYPYTMREFSTAVGKYYGGEIISLPKWIVYLAAYGLGLFKMIGMNVPLYPFRLHNIMASYCYDIGNSVKLGFFPKYSLEQGIRETLMWYDENDPDFSK
jgi:GlcNAc-P-P-Und epimerase